MAPQPFSPAHKGKHFCFDKRGLEADVQAAALLGRILGEWSRVEHQNAMLMAALMGENPRPGLALFTSLRGSRAQKEAQAAVVKVSSSQELVPLIDALQLIHGSLTKERNKLVHGMLGWSADLPGATLVVHSDNIADYEAAAWIRSQGGSLTDHAELEAKLYVYKHDDFTDVLRRMEELSLHLFYMYCIIRHGKDKQANMYKILVEHPDIEARIKPGL